MVVYDRVNVTLAQLLLQIWGGGLKLKKCCGLEYIFALEVDILSIFGWALMYFFFKLNLRIATGWHHRTQINCSELVSEYAIYRCLSLARTIGVTLT